MHSPHTDPRPPLPVVRAAVFALVGGVLGLTAHRLAAREPADWAASGPAAAALFAVGLLQARRPRHLSQAIAVNSAAQAALHEWFLRTGSGTTGPAPHGHPGGAAGAHGAGQEVLLGLSATTVAHALAAVLVAVLLHGADAACWSPPHAMAAVPARVRKPIHAVWSLLSAPPAPVAPSAAPYPSRRTEPRAHTGGLLTEVVVRRGPPAGVRTRSPAREPAPSRPGPTHHDPETP
ncbi:hypothetical protein [Streptomyces wuyuanensis]|uniref:hypothetical protein n=1 Tax=Streptomyces wuyuanensis TaxID=1196353 RepID=UPI00371A388E